jgi:hypothetical protein
VQKKYVERGKRKTKNHGLTNVKKKSHKEKKTKETWLNKKHERDREEYKYLKRDSKSILEEKERMDKQNLRESGTRRDSKTTVETNDQ